jgi:glycoprotein endo-alpha-1,2-mannosidase
MRRLLAGGFLIAYLALAGLAQAGTVATFYYPWYGTPPHDGTWEHWAQNGHKPPVDVYSQYFPAVGPYSSDDPRVVYHQMSQIAGAGIDEVVISWWGKGSIEDQRLPLVVSAARAVGLEPAIHLEPYDGRTPASVAGDLAYLAGLKIRDVYVYHPRDFSAVDWQPVTKQKPAGMRLFAGTELVGFAAAAGFDGFYTYDFIDFGGGKFTRLCSQAHAHNMLCAPSVGPGYNGVRAGELSVTKPRSNGQTYDRLWKAAVRAHPDVVTITSYNEWGEGTQIEPAAARAGYRSYDGAWGLHGKAAQTAYLTRTAYWSAIFHGLK